MFKNNVFFSFSLNKYSCVIHTSAHRVEFVVEASSPTERGPRRVGTVCFIVFSLRLFLGYISRPKLLPKLGFT